MLPYGTIVKRFFAYLLDVLLVSVLAGIVMGALMFATGSTPVDPVIYMIIAAAELLWFVPQEAGKKGATVGKRCMGLIVAGTDGKKAKTLDILVRNTVRVLPQIFMAIFYNHQAATVIIGLVMIASCLVVVLNPQRRALHDMAAGTIVLKKDAVTLSQQEMTPVTIAPQNGTSSDRTIAPQFVSGVRSIHCTRGIYAGGSFPLDQPMIMGRGAGDVNLHFPEECKGISRRHAVVSQNGQAVIIRDCGSTNGIDVCGNYHMRQHEERTLQIGDTFTIGETQCFVVR